MTDITLAFTRPYVKAFNEMYSPVASHRYKLLIVHHLKYQFRKHYVLTTINALDAFENRNQSGEYSCRITNGGRLEYMKNNFYVTISGYYQYGRDPNMKKVQAYYIQPEIRAIINKATIRLGTEILSGEKKPLSNTSHSFVPLYGVAWKFMGNMNFFTKFPADVNNKGLINPYLFLIFRLDKKIFLRADGNLFYVQYPLNANNKVPRYLGFENDLSFHYKPIETIEINLGFSYLISERSMELLGKVTDSDKIPVWSYIMVSYKPGILKYKK